MIWRFVAKGRVQGVGYRATIHRTVCRDLPKIKGYVKNLRDKTVEIVAEGTQEELELIEIIAREGSTMGHVSELLIDKDYMVGAPLISFTIEH